MFPFPLNTSYLHHHFYQLYVSSKILTEKKKIPQKDANK